MQTPRLKERGWCVCVFLCVCADHRTVQRQGAKMAWWELLLLGAYWWAGVRRGGRGRSGRREYVFCCFPLPTPHPPPFSSAGSIAHISIKYRRRACLQNTETETEAGTGTEAGGERGGGGQRIHPPPLPVSSLGCSLLPLVTNTPWSHLQLLLKDVLCNLREEALYVEPRWEKGHGVHDVLKSRHSPGCLFSFFTFGFDWFTKKQQK